MQPVVVKSIALQMLPIAMVITLSGCMVGQTKKQEERKYNEICTHHPEGPSVVESQPPEPKIFKPDTIEYGIAEARLNVYLLNERYRLLTCRKERVNRDDYDLPMIGTLIAGSAAALAKANVYVLGGLGIVAGTIGTTKSYMHPDTDRDDFRKANQKLTCILDETQVLRYNNHFEVLLATRQLLDQAIAAVRADIADHPIDANKASVADKAALKSAQDALDAGELAVKSISDAEVDYRKLPGTINAIRHHIDFVAGAAASTNTDYSKINASLKDAYSSAADSKAQVDDLKKKISKAQGAAAGAASAQSASGKASSPLMRALDQTKTQNMFLASAVAPLNPCAEDLPSSGCAFVDKNFALVTVESSTPQPLREARIVENGTTTHVTKLTQLATSVAETMPHPTYSDVVASITTCKNGS